MSASQSSPSLLSGVRRGVRDAGRPMLLVLAALLLAPQAARADSETLRFGVRADVPPLAMRAGDRWEGYTVELCRRIFEAYRASLPADHGAALEWVPVTAAGRFDALASGRIDALCGATTLTLSRLDSFPFTLLTYVSGAAVMARRDAALPALRRETGRKLRVAVVTGTTTEGHVETVLGDDVDVVERPDHDAAFAALEEGAADLYMADRVFLLERLRRLDAPAAWDLVEGVVSREPYAIPVRPGRRDLLAVANRTLAALYWSGEIRRIHARWFPGVTPDARLEALWDLMRLPE